MDKECVERLYLRLRGENPWSKVLSSLSHWAVRKAIDINFVTFSSVARFIGCKLTKLRGKENEN